MSRRTSIAHVAAAYRSKSAEEIRGEWGSALVYRPISFVLTPIFVACAATPTGVTLLGLACALLLPCIASAGGAYAWLGVGALGIAFCILDCVDGDLARVTERMSARGAYVDFITDIVYRIAFYAALGIVIDADAPESHGAWLVLGLLSAAIAIAARACRLYAGARKRNAPAPSPEPFTIGGAAYSFLSGIDSLLPIAVLIFGALHALPWMMVYVAVYSFGDFATTQLAVVRRVK